MDSESPVGLSNFYIARIFEYSSPRTRLPTCVINLNATVAYSDPRYNDSRNGPCRNALYSTYIHLKKKKSMYE